MASIMLLGQQDAACSGKQVAGVQQAAKAAYDHFKSELTTHASMKTARFGWQLAGPGTPLPSTILHRQCVGGSPAARVNLGQRFLPPMSGWGPACSIDDQHSASIFCGKFSGDGTVFATACQDASIRLYSIDQLLFLMQAEKERREEQAREGRRIPKGQTPVQPYKTIEARDVGWSIIDSDFSKDKRFVAYSSWSRYLHLASVDKETDKHESFEVRRQRGGGLWSDNFCLFSIRFSDSSDVIAGGANDAHLYIYNIERRVVQNRVRAHADDVNAVIFADRFSSNILLSGSDDALIKLWDLRAPNAPRGLLMGHSGGITSLSSKGNGFNFLSNAKDQTAKLWDLRVMAEPSAEVVRDAEVLDQPDYRHGMSLRRRHAWPRLPRDRDLSLQTMMGHQVTRTLIRCCFSPEETTGGRYACTGSSDGRILLFDLLADNPSPNDVIELDFHATPVRDLSFHPTLPLMVSSSWDRRLALWQFGGQQDTH